MNSNEHPSASPAEPPPAAAKPATPVAGVPRRGRSGQVGVLLGVLALLGVAALAWLQWQASRLGADSVQNVAALSTRLDVVEERAQQLQAVQNALTPQLADLHQQQQAAAGQWQGIDQRLRSLEAAVTRLSERTLSAHDALLLDESESLLRTGQERYQLFHDTAGAISAYGLAATTLERLNDLSLNGVRQSLDKELAALRQSRPAAGLSIDVLQRLRQVVAEAPLRTASAAADDGEEGVWARVRRVLQRLVSVRRDDRHDDPLTQADQRLVRELAELDVIEAQSALLAGDQAGWRGALQRVQTSLQQRYDVGNGEVAQALANLGNWLQAASTAALPQLGASLAELRDLRRVKALQVQPAAASTLAAPARAASAANTAVPAVPATASSTGGQR